MEKSAPRFSIRKKHSPQQAINLLSSLGPFILVSPAIETSTNTATNAYYSKQQFLHVQFFKSILTHRNIDTPIHRIFGASPEKSNVNYISTQLNLLNFYTISPVQVPSTQQRTFSSPITTSDIIALFSLLVSVIAAGFAYSSKKIQEEQATSYKKTELREIFKTLDELRNKLNKANSIPNKSERDSQVKDCTDAIGMNLSNFETVIRKLQDQGSSICSKEYGVLAKGYAAVLNFAKAKDFYEEALKIARKEYEAESEKRDCIDYVDALIDLGHFSFQRHEPEKGREKYEEAIKTLEGKIGKDSSNEHLKYKKITIYVRHGEDLYVLGRKGEAQDKLKEANKELPKITDLTLNQKAEDEINSLTQKLIPSSPPGSST